MTSCRPAPTSGGQEGRAPGQDAGLSPGVAASVSPVRSHPELVCLCKLGLQRNWKLIFLYSVAPRFQKVSFQSLAGVPHVPPAPTPRWRAGCPHQHRPNWAPGPRVHCEASSRKISPPGPTAFQRETLPPVQQGRPGPGESGGEQTRVHVWPSRSRRPATMMVAGCTLIQNKKMFF